MVCSVSSLVYASIKIIYVLKAPNEGSKILKTGSEPKVSGMRVVFDDEGCMNVVEVGKCGIVARQKVV